MLNPLPSSLQGKEREKYVLETAKRLCDEWNFLPPKDYDKEKIKEHVKKRDKYLGIDSEFIWTTSPLSLASSLYSSLGSSLRSSLKSPLGSSLRSSLRLSLESSLGSPLESSLRLSLSSSLESSLRLSLRSSLWPSLESLLGLSPELSLCPSLWSPLWSPLGSSLWSWYRFLFRDIYYQFNENPEIKNFMQFLPDAYSSGLGFAFITDNRFYALPIPDYHLNREAQLHRDLAPAVIWPDGEKEFYFNGVCCYDKSRRH